MNIKRLTTHLLMGIIMVASFTGAGRTMDLTDLARKGLASRFPGKTPIEVQIASLNHSLSGVNAAILSVETSINLVNAFAEGSREHIPNLLQATWEALTGSFPSEYDPTDAISATLHGLLLTNQFLQNSALKTLDCGKDGLLVPLLLPRLQCWIIELSAEASFIDILRTELRQVGVPGKAPLPEPVLPTQLDLGDSLAFEFVDAAAASPVVGTDASRRPPSRTARGGISNKPK
jgi:hypothetical protein